MSCPTCGAEMRQLYTLRVIAPRDGRLTKTSLRSKAVKVENIHPEPAIWCDECGFTALPQPRRSKAERDALREYAIRHELT